MKTKNNYNSCKMLNIQYVAAFLMLCIFSINQANAQTYPFKQLPDTVVATLNIETAQKEPFINQLLGYNISRFTSNDEKDLIKKFDPITIRFPQGIFSNWYDWRIDDFTYYSPWTHEDHKAVVDGQPKAGVVGLQSLNTDKAKSNGVGYDFLITWNMSDDGAKGNDLNTNTESIERLKHYKAIGFDVNAIEFGNELFYRNQRSTYVPDEATFIARAKSLSRDLKAIDSNIKVSIPLIFRGSATNPNWNQLIAADKSYYDAITVHKYIGVDVDNRLDLSSIGYEFGLAARLSLEPAVTFARTYSGDKPVWLTEWGVDVGNSPTGNAASCLGMADCYIYMSENQNIYQRANWFTANSSANQHVKLVANTFATIEYPLKKTGYGFTYDIIRSVFENSTMLSSSLSTASKLELIGSSVNAVSARAVVKDGKKMILALNLTDKPAVLQLNVDGSAFAESYDLEAFKFDSLGHLPIIPFDANPINYRQNGSGQIILQPLSVNRITLKGPAKYAVRFETPLHGAKFDIGSDFVVEATAGSEVTGVKLFINQTLVRNIASPPYKWGESADLDAALKNLEVGNYQLKLVAENADTISFSDSINIHIQDTARQQPYNGIIQIPGTIEAENYDIGGQGISYFDSNETNSGLVYRQDDVDIGEFSPGLYNIGWTANGEWLEYTVNVEDTGLYDVAFHYSAGRTTAAKVGLELSDERNVLFSNFTLPITGSWDKYEIITKTNVQLSAGKHVLRLNINVSGCNIDKMVFSKAGTSSANAVRNDGLRVYPNPSANGQFHLSSAQQWAIYSIDGVKLLEGVGTKIDLSAFNNGVFICKTENAFFKLIRE